MKNDFFRDDFLNILSAFWIHSSDFSALLLATSSTGKKRPRELETKNASSLKNKLQSSHTQPRLRQSSLKIWHGLEFEMLFEFLTVTQNRVIFSQIDFNTKVKGNLHSPQSPCYGPVRINGIGNMTLFKVTVYFRIPFQLSMKRR